jgi:hypothetical protein
MSLGRDQAGEILPEYSSFKLDIIILKGGVGYGGHCQEGGIFCYGRSEQAG